jgi:cyclophilin family peptidyl-prolyl cis-trans isomerase
VRHGYYDGSALYRVLPGFVAQFGVAADPTLARVYDYRANHPGAILEDDPAIVPPDGPGNDKLWLAYSAAYDERASPPRAVNRTAELFVNLVDNRAGLDARGFASFARVAGGSDVIDKWFAGYGEMQGACDLHPDKGYVCEGPSETELYGVGVAGGYVDASFPKLDRIGYVTARPNPTDPDPHWYYGTSKHHFSWSEGGEGHGVLFYIVFSATLLMFFLLIRRQKTVSSKERRLS